MLLLLLLLLFLQPLGQGQIVSRVVVVGVESQGLFGTFDSLSSISFHQSADAGVVVCKLLQPRAFKPCGSLVEQRLGRSPILGLHVGTPLVVQGNTSHVLVLGGLSEGLQGCVGVAVHESL